LLYLLARWAWWDWPVTWLTNRCPSVLSLLVGSSDPEVVPEMTYNVCSGSLNLMVIWLLPCW